MANISSSPTMVRSRCGCWSWPPARRSTASPYRPVRAACPSRWMAGSRPAAASAAWCTCGGYRGSLMRSEPWGGLSQRQGRTMSKHASEVLRHIRQTVTEEDSVPDAELLKRFVQHADEAAFAVLVRRHGPLVLGLCQRQLRHTQDAEDVFQSTFL